MKRSIKKVAATVLASVTMFSALATTSNAASTTSYIGEVYIPFCWGTVYVAVGDCNQDGVINIADLVALKRNANHGWYYFNAWAVYDCNQDGYVDNNDVKVMTNYLFG
ncbi:MAG: dockerin type I domain-containing protein [Clostridia bacterium]|nr:dockerin type I domain-containing protein [Clostridia bacterium]